MQMGADRATLVQKHRLSLVAGTYLVATESLDKHDRTSLHVMIPVFLSASPGTISPPLSKSRPGNSVRVSVVETRPVSLGRLAGTGRGSRPWGIDIKPNLPTTSTIPPVSQSQKEEILACQTLQSLKENTPTCCNTGSPRVAASDSTSARITILPHSLHSSFIAVCAMGCLVTALVPIP